MILSNEKINDLSLEYMEKQYAYTATDTESVIDRLISLDEQLQNYPFYNGNKKIIRQFIAQKLFDELKTCTPDKDSAGYLVFSRKIEAFFFCYKLFLNVSEADFEEIELYERIIKCKQQAKVRKDFSYLPEVIVSMTTFPGRIDTVYKALNSIFTQSFKPDRVILWLAEEQFPDKQLPQSLTDYVSLGLEIRWCKEDLRSHKKYYYVMQEYPKAIVITVDDDLIYDRQLVEALVASYLHFPDAVSAARTHLMKIGEDGKIAPYSQWIKEFSGVLGKPSMQLFSTSGAGTLYPPACMGEELFNIDNIKKYCFNADDIWFKVMQIKNCIPVVLARENESLIYVPETQGIGLYRMNEGLNENDIQLNNLLDIYDSDDWMTPIIFADGYTAFSKIVGLDIYQNNDFGLLYAVSSKLYDSLKIENEYIKLEKKYADLLNEYKKRSNDYFAFKTKVIHLEQQLKKTEEANKIINREMVNIKGSISFKVGNYIAYIPGKIICGIKCYRDNGLVYTVKRLFVKIRNKLK